jgi:hypothetical protein
MRRKLMGRKKIYFTVKDKKEAQKKWQMDYYYRNKETILKKMKDKYRQKKLNLSKTKITKELYGE